jgi:hypothetical protein
MSIDLTKTLKGYKPQNAKNEAIKTHAENIAKALTAAGVKDQATLYNARGNVALPAGVDIFEVVSFLDGEYQQAAKQVDEPKAAKTVKE